jgi:hypothetical protein
MKKKITVPFMMCRGNIYVRKDAPSITIGHELEHFNHYKALYDNYMAVLDKVTHRCVCPVCLRAMFNWMVAQREVLLIETEIADLQTDVEDYPKVGAGGQQWADRAKWALGSVEAALDFKQQKAARLRREMNKQCAGESGLKGVQF